MTFTGSFIPFTWYLQAPLLHLHENLQAPLFHLHENLQAPLFDLHYIYRLLYSTSMIFTDSFMRFT